MAKLPTVTSNIPRDLRTFLDRVREALDSGGPDAVITARQLVASGVATYTGNVLGPPGSVKYSASPRPRNVVATGALANIMVTWDKPVYTGHAYAEIWASAQTAEQEAANTNPTIGEAALVGMSPGVFFAHNLGSAAKRWYWVRFVNFAGEAGPYQSTEGITGETSLDPEYVLELLTGAVTESQLYQTLGARIALIDSDATVVGSVAARIAAEAQARTSALAAEAAARGTAVTSEQTARQSADNALAQSITTLTSSVGGNTSAIQGEQTARSTADSALASDITVLDTRLTTAEGGVTGFASAFTGLDTRVTTAEGEITANSSDITVLDTRLTTAEGGVTGFASAFTGLDTRVTTAEGEITANSSDITSLTASVGTNAAAISAEATARANADTAEATARTTFQATLGADLTSAVQTEATARAAADGVIEAKYTVKVDVGGHVAGYGLIANANNGATVSEFGIRADQFFLAPPTIAQTSAPASSTRYVGMSWVDTNNNNQQRYWSGTAWVVDSPSLPFIVRTSPTTINGEAVPAGVYIRDGFIQNGTIVNAQIGDAAIDDAKIANIDAGKINAGFIDAARIEAGSIDANMIDSRGLSIKDAAGNIILAAGTPLSASNFSGLGTLATANDITMSSVTDAGTLATANDITMSSVTDAGALATADNITMASVTNAGSFATLSQITTANVSTYIGSAAIKLANIDTATITNLASIAVDAGTITAGVLKSSDNKFVIDLNNKTISIET